MTNSIRTPKQGKTEHSRKVAAATDDYEWQKFRLSLKGISTQDKLDKLTQYYYDNTPGPIGASKDYLIRIDNYLKALARGGQIAPRTDYIQGLLNNNLTIRK